MAGDPLLLGQRVIAILEQGQRDATSSLATLMALIEHSIENLPFHADDTLTVPIPELAHRVLALYWHQVRPFEGHDLAQRRTGTKTRIVDATKALREASKAGNRRMSLEMAMLRAPAARGGHRSDSAGNDQAATPAAAEAARRDGERSLPL